MSLLGEVASATVKIDKESIKDINNILTNSALKFLLVGIVFISVYTVFKKYSR